LIFSVNFYITRTSVIMKQTYNKIAMATSALILVGCSGFDTGSSNSSSSSSASTDTATSPRQQSTIGRAYYVDSAVSGVNYVCGSQRGTTDKDGMFLFEVGKGCTFSIGTMLLRDVDANLLYDGENLYELDTKTASVLQGLDIDQDLENGIVIDQDIVSMLDIDYNRVPTTSDELKKFKSAMRSEGAEVPTVDKSEKHVVKTILANGLYRVENNKTQKLSFKDSGDIEIVEDEKVVDNASYHIDNNNNITIRDKDTLSVQTEKPKREQQYISMSKNKLWFSKRLAEQSKNSRPQNSAYSVEESQSEYVASQHPIDNDLSNQYLKAINRARSQIQDCGKYGSLGPVDPLSWNTHLYNAAIEHSIDMGTLNFFSHKGSGEHTDITATYLGLDNGSTSADRVSFNGYGYQAQGENIAAGIDNLDGVIATWIDSDDHCANLMSSSFTEVGMGLYVAKDTKHKYFWTQVFGTK